MNILYFDCMSGISGDMAVGAFLDMGIDPNSLASELSKLELDAIYDIEAEKVDKNGVRATAFNIYVDKSRSVYDFEDTAQIILKSKLDSRAKKLSLLILKSFADAKSSVYGLNQTFLKGEDAVRAVVNMVSAAICVSMLGADKIISSPLTEGLGYAMTESGLMRVPVPCVTEILKESGAPIEICAEKTQLITPTGAAIICSLAQGFDEMPSMTVSATGFGAGKKDLDSRANILRVIMGRNEPVFYEESMCLIDTDSTYSKPGFLNSCK
ncbi:MAG: LarC family nickel insertion protein [Clostridia bacterium]|nr:LarC family nickel insertion protein [Clostridia bacterium]